MNSNAILTRLTKGLAERRQQLFRLGAALGALALILTAVWQLQGGYIYTRTAVAEVQRDELFGTESIEWREDFRMGLLPSGADPLAATSVAGILGFAMLPLGALLLWRRDGRTKLQTR